MKRPCLRCGDPTEGSYCIEHRPAEQRKTKRSATALGYDTAWRKLSERARRLQPWCSDCGTTTDLTADHLPIAWQRKAEGKVIRLQDVEVVCRICNIARGSTRGESPDRVLSDSTGGVASGVTHPPGVSGTRRTR